MLVRYSKQLVATLSGLLLAPSFVLAQEDFKEAVWSVTDFIKTLIPLLTAAALLLFFWGLAEYVFAAGGDEKEVSKQRMLWGVIGLFVITSIWAIVQFLGSSIAIL